MMVRDLLVMMDELREYLDKDIDYAKIIFKDDKNNGHDSIYIRIVDEKDVFGCCTVEKYGLERNTVFIRVNETEREGILKGFETLENKSRELKKAFDSNKVKDKKQFYSDIRKEMLGLLRVYMPIYEYIESIDNASGEG